MSSDASEADQAAPSLARVDIGFEVTAHSRTVVAVIAVTTILIPRLVGDPWPAWRMGIASLLVCTAAAALCHRYFVASLLFGPDGLTVRQPARCSSYRVPWSSLSAVAASPRGLLVITRASGESTFVGPFRNPVSRISARQLAKVATQTAEAASRWSSRTEQPTTELSDVGASVKMARNTSSE